MSPIVVVQFLAASSISAMIGWTLWSAIRDMLAVAKQMHQIPCANCRYFTNDYHLKCSVQPTIANTEMAVNCSDYRPL